MPVLPPYEHFAECLFHIYVTRQYVGLRQLRHQLVISVTFPGYQPVLTSVIINIRVVGS